MPSSSNDRGKIIPLKKPGIPPDMLRLVQLMGGAISCAGVGLCLLGYPLAGIASTTLGTYMALSSSSKMPAPLFIPKKNTESLVFFGNDEYGFPIFIPIDELTRHMLLLGTTGSGKTTLLRLMTHTFLRAGGGVSFIDGKADVFDMYSVFYTLVRDADRLEDLLVLNFLNPSQSHSFNPFMYGDADFLSEVLAGLLPDSGGKGDSEYWQGRAKVMMRSLMTVLVWLRDNKGLNLHIGTIREYLGLSEMVKLALDPDIPEHSSDGRMVKSRLISYLNELGPSWDLLRDPNAMKNPQNAVTLRAITEQHGYAIQQWSEPLDLLSGKYRYIFYTPKGSDIDIRDVVTNSRCLYVLLPSLELSPSTLRGLGRLILSTFKIAFSSQLGRDVIGDFRGLRDKIQSTRPLFKHLLIADEYGSYAVEGFDTAMAQARSLGIGIVISIQELASLFKANEQEAKRLIGNTNLKVFLKIEDPDTAKYAIERSGQDWVLVPAAREYVGVFTRKIGNLDLSYQYQRHDRVEIIELTNFRPGQGLIVTGGEVRRFSYPYIKGEEPKNMVLWGFAPADEVSDSSIVSLASDKAEVKERLINDVFNACDYFGRSIPKRVADLIEKSKREWGMDSRSCDIMKVLHTCSGGYPDDDIVFRRMGSGKDDEEDGEYFKILSGSAINDICLREAVKKLMGIDLADDEKKDEILSAMKDIVIRRKRFMEWCERMLSEVSMDPAFAEFLGNITEKELNEFLGVLQDF